jgi:predicted transcriptional regulator of viral defense system
MVETQNRSAVQWIDEAMALGKYSFASEDLQNDLPTHSGIALKRVLNRMSRKGKILSIHKGYYLQIPPQYASKGILPPQFYLDALMKHLNRPYYVGLLSAAAFHGASHQQAQEYFVMTGFPVMRPLQKNGQKINYVSIKNIPVALIELHKTESGYLHVSNAALTACDLVQYEKRIGGINRAASVINELAEVLKPADFSSTLLHHSQATTLQRLGYLLEYVCAQQALADALHEAMEKEGLHFFRIPLKASKEAKNIPADKRWNVIVNLEMEIDE